MPGVRADGFGPGGFGDSGSGGGRLAFARTTACLSPPSGLTPRAPRAIAIISESRILKAPMPVRLDRSSADFDERFGKFLGPKREVSADVEAAARSIVQDVATRGDAEV